MKKLLIVVVLLIGISVVAIFSFPAVTTAGAEKFTMAYVPPALISPVFIECVDGIKEAAAKFDNLEVIVLAPTVETKVEEQVKILEDLIIKKVDLICISAGNWEAVRPTLIKAIENGIEVVLQDRLEPLEGVNALALIGIDEVKGGEVAGEYCVDMLNGNGKVVVLEGVAGDYWTIRNGKGFDKIVNEYPGIEIVARQPANWERAKGMEVMENILQANREIAFVYAFNDNMALGALQAIENAGSFGDIYVLGMNAQQDALREIEEGRLNATISKDPRNTGRIIVNNIVAKVMEGKREEIEPVLGIPPVLVTEENFRDYLRE